MSDPSRFLSRWSRLKRQASVEVPVVASDPQVLPSSVAGENVTLQIDSGTDLTAMLREELSEAVRRQTLKAIFADPHFNVMDGLDTYIDDYSISEPIPPEMMATLNQARFLFETEDAKTESLPDVTDTPEILENASSVTAPIKES
jgi:hypothetical protein